MTIVNVTDTVLLEDVKRLGLNPGEDNYYDSPLLKKRVEENFEGTLYRRCLYGTGGDANGASSWFKNDGDWAKRLLDGKLTLLSGEGAWQSCHIKGFSSISAAQGRQKRELTYFEFDRKMPTLPQGGGFLVEKMLPEDGQAKPNPSKFWSENVEVINTLPRPGGCHCGFETVSSRDFTPASDGRQHC